MARSALLGAAAAAGLAAGSEAGLGACSPTEVFTNFGNTPDQLMVGWATACSADTTVNYGLTPSGLTKSVSGSSATYSLEGGSYVSPYLHHALLAGLPSNTLVYYQVGSAASGWSAVYNVTTHPGVGADIPVSFGVVGDLGQTDNSATTLQHLMDGMAAAASSGIRWNSVLLVGDLSYADLYGPRWDSWQSLVAPLTSQLPMMTLCGNHEIELDTNLQTFESYKARFWMPQIYYGSAQARRDLYYSANIGPVHWVALNSYSEYTPGSAQYAWLQADFAAVDRAVTPWVVVGLHAPWYNSNTAHQGEGEPMRQALEAMFYSAGVDLVMSGHVHAYEFNTRVFNGSVNAGGPYYVTIGDGGNREGLALNWIDPQPAISLFRQSTYGHGVLTVYNGTHALWTWHADPDVENAVRHSQWIVKGQTLDTAHRQTVRTRLRETASGLKAAMQQVEQEEAAAAAAAPQPAAAARLRKAAKKAAAAAARKA